MSDSEPLIKCESCGRHFAHKDIIACYGCGMLICGACEDGDELCADCNEWMEDGEWRDAKIIRPKIPFIQPFQERF